MNTRIDLEVEARRLTMDLGGQWHGNSGMARCPAHADRTPSLSIAAGRKTVLLHCFAGCEFTEIISALREQRVFSSTPLPANLLDYPVERKDFGPLARRIWSHSLSLEGTLAERYLKGRGLTAPWTDLRFHPHAPFGGGSAVISRPALIAAVRDESGIVAIHRIALDVNTGGKASDLPNPKLTLGVPKRGAVRLYKAGRTLGIAEGIETAKSAARILGIPVWASLGSERMSKIAIPFDVTRLVLLPDRGAAGERATALSREAHGAPGRSIETILPPDPHSDWNDADQAQQKLACSPWEVRMPGEDGLR